MATSRREFLIRSAALGLGAWGVPRLLGFDEPPAPADMAIARWQDAERSPEQVARGLTEKAIEALGGMGRFVSRGAVVWIKPNIGWNRAPEFGANTNPVVVATLIKLCLNAGAKTVKVGDYTCNPASQTYETSGIAPAARELGAEVVFLDGSRFRSMAVGGNRLKDHPVYPEIVESDLVINVPICKHHGGTKVTLCMKNYMGVVNDRGTFHQDLPATIADITQFMRPRLCVLDATRLLLRHGPTGGKLEDVKIANTVAAGTDIVALDAFGCELLGHKPETVGTVAKGLEYKLGKLDYRALNLKELSLS